jgi:hypothetical protein
MSKKKIFEKDSNLANEDSGFAANEFGGIFASMCFYYTFV